MLQHIQVLFLFIYYYFGLDKQTREKKFQAMELQKTFPIGHKRDKRVRIKLEVSLYTKIE